MQGSSAQVVEMIAEKLNRELKARSQNLKVLEDFRNAYLAETGLSPSEVELVVDQDSEGFGIILFFRRKAG